MQAAQKVFPARPQRVKTRGVPLRYVEDLNDARTKLEDFFSSLLVLGFAGIQIPMLPVEPGMAQFMSQNVAPPGYG